MADPAKPKILLDCDPGHDDAVAILMAAHYGDLLAITTVSGNVALDLTSRNALVTAQLLGLDTQVHAGAERPLTAQSRHAAEIHGESGMEGPELPELTRELSSRDAVRLIIDTARTTDDLWLVATGPLTNIALALRQAPDIARSIMGVAIMGGSATFGNRTPKSEFNIWYDPEAAHIVFSSGAQLIMCGLNLTHQFMITGSELERIRAKSNRTAAFVADMLEFYANRYADRHFGRLEGPLHDPCAVLAVTHPELFELRPRHVAIERTGEHTRGMTVVDEREVVSTAPANVRVAYHIDARRAFELLLEAIAAYP